MKIPGPGSCKIFILFLDPVCFTINEKGTYFLSKFKNSCVRNFKTTCSREKTAESKIPGPGSYNLEKTDFSPNGKYYLSRIPSVLTRKFGKSERSNIIANT